MQGDQNVINEQNSSKYVAVATIKASCGWQQRRAHANEYGMVHICLVIVLFEICFIFCKLRDSIFSSLVRWGAHRAHIPITHSTGRALELLNLVHTDVCGPLETASICGPPYFVTFFDAYFNWVFVHPKKH